jgi:predicted NUDIX family NTP pyrophosphohydrolase
MDRDKGRWVPPPREGTSGQEELRAAHRAEAERLAAEVGDQVEGGPERVVEIVQAYREVTADEVFTDLRMCRLSDNLAEASWDPRSEVAQDTVMADMELRTGERFRVLVQRLR